MPEYVYECLSCHHTLEKIQGMSENPLKRCPKCRKHKLERVPQAINFGVKKHTSELKTLYDVGSRNRDNMSEEQREKFKADSNTKNNRARKQLGKGQSYMDISGGQERVDNSLADLTPEQKKTYIEKGIKPLKSDDTWHSFPSQQKKIKAEKKKEKILKKKIAARKKNK